MQKQDQKTILRTMIDDASVVLKVSKKKSLEPRASIANFQTLAMLKPKHGSKLSKRKSLSSKLIEIPQDPEEVIVLEGAKQCVVKLMAELHEVIKQNNETPSVQALLSPLVKSIEETFPHFHRQAIQFYRNYDTAKKEATSAQVISTAPVHIPLEAFLKGWRGLEKVIDSATVTHPPPHAAEITAKFKAVKSSLEVIIQMNNVRKFPNAGVTKSVLSIQSLCDSITDSMNELFKQPQFPNFKTDSLKVYKADVKGFMHVVQDSFYNEFPQSGIPLTDLSRIKLNIMSSCNDIISSLTAGFAFIPMMERAKLLKDKYNEEMEQLLVALQEPFYVVKPQRNEDVYLTASFSRAPTQERLVQERDVNAESQLRMMDPNRRLDLFLYDVLPCFGIEPETVEDPWDELIHVGWKVKDLAKRCESKDSLIEKLRKTVDDLKQEVKDLKKINGDRDEYAALAVNMAKKELGDVKQQLVKSNNEKNKLQKVIAEQQEQIEKLNDRTDLENLKSDIRRVLVEFVDATDEEINNMTASDHLEQMKLVHFSQIENYEGIIEDTRNRFARLLMVDDDLDYNELIDQVESIIQDSNEKMSFTLPLPDESDKSSVVTDISTSRSSDKTAPKSISLTSTTARRQTQADYDDIYRQLTELRESYFRDLRSIAERLENYVAGRYKSEHSFVMHQMVDEPTSTQTHLFGLINDQWEAMKSLIMCFIDNNQETKEELIKTKDELLTWTSRISAALGEQDNVLDRATNLITNTQNPLREKLVELSNELVKRDTELDTIWKRVSGIRNDGRSEVKEVKPRIIEGEYYTVEKSNIAKMIITSLCDIQDKYLALKKENASLSGELQTMSAELWELADRLARFLGESNEKVERSDLAERVQKFVDVIISPAFSDAYMKVDEIDDMYREIIPEGMLKPQEYLPAICEQYHEMKIIIEETKQFIHAADSVLAALNVDDFTEAQATALQNGVNNIHAALRRLKGSILSTPVFVVITRFVSLLQALVAKLGSLAGTTLKLV